MGSDNERFKLGLEIELNFGKHKGLTLKQVCKEDPEYIEWLAFNTKQFALGRLKQEVILEAKKYGATFIPK